MKYTTCTKRNSTTINIWKILRNLEMTIKKEKDGNRYKLVFKVRTSNTPQLADKKVHNLVILLTWSFVAGQEAPSKLLSISDPP